MRESETIELKKSSSELKEALVSISAILNKHGKGEIYFGVKNDGAVVGQSVSETTLRKISKAVSDKIEPKIFPNIEEVILDDKSCVKVSFDGADAPYWANGKAYVRVADEDRQLSARELEKIIVEKNKNCFGWDDQSVERAAISDIEESNLRSFVSRANSAGRLKESFSGCDTVLSKLNLISPDGKLTNTAMALFCENNNIKLQMAIFATENKVTFNDIKQEEGTLFDLLDKAELYLRNNLRWRVQFGKLEREEIPEIPIEALREALVNSFH